MQRDPSSSTPVQRRSSLGTITRSALLVGAGAVLGGAVAVHSATNGNPAVAQAPAAATASAKVRPTAVATRPASTPTSSGTGGAAPVSGAAPLPQMDQLRVTAINRARVAVVEVENIGVGLGSGVIIRKDGYIVTNNHVVAGGHQYRVDLANGTQLAATLVGTDATDDLAVIRIQPPRTLPTATLGDSSRLQVGQTVLAIGNPLGVVNTVTDGIVSALNRNVSEGQQSSGGPSGSILNAVRTNAAINPGNSGGALIDLSGAVIGIPTLAAVDPEFNTPASGVGFAIPSNTVQRIAAQLIQYGKVMHSGRAAFGVAIAAVTPDVAAQYNLPVDHGLLVSKLAANGPAQKAGIAQGDVILKVDGKDVATYDNLLAILANKRAGDTVTVNAVTAQGQARTFQVTLGELAVSQ